MHITSKHSFDEFSDPLPLMLHTASEITLGPGQGLEGTVDNIHSKSMTFDLRATSTS